MRARVLDWLAPLSTRRVGVATLDTHARLKLNKPIRLNRSEKECSYANAGAQREPPGFKGAKGHVWPCVMIGAYVTRDGKSN
jgi:hypothetical protein